MKRFYFVKFLVCLFLLGFALNVAGQTTYNFDAGSVISQPPGSIWNTQANITIGGIAYKLTSCCNGGFSNSADGGNGNSASLMKTGSGGDTFILERADGLPFQFYGFYVAQESINSYVGAFPGIPPFYEITYTKTAGAPETEVDNTPVSGGTYTTSGKTYTKNLTVTQVSILFKANNRYWIDDIRVGVVAGTEVAPTVTTTAASAIASTSATLGGNVTADGGATVNDRGIVWATSTNPTTANNKVPNGSGTGSFSASVGSLPFNTTIYFRAYAINSEGTSYGANLSFTTLAPTVVVNPATAAGATVGVSYSQTFTGSGGTSPYTFLLSAGSLPTGLTLNMTTGALTGTPTSSGTFNFTIRATDNSGSGGPFSNTRAYTVVVAPPVTVIAPTTVASTTVGTVYSQTFTASGGISPYTFAVTAGALPAGTSLNTSTGVVSGTPTAGGTFNFTITATGSSTGTGSPHTGSRAYSLVVGAPSIAINPATLPGASIGLAYSQTISATGGTSPRSFAITAGSLPPGMTLSTGGVVSGTPTGGGTYNFSVTATDASTGTGPYTGVKAYSITVGAPTIAVNPATVPNPTVATAYTQTLTASGGTSPYSFAITAGALPAGLTLSTTGVLSGTATAGGTFNFTVTATDASGGAGPYTGSKAYSITVGAPTIAIAPAALPSATVGTAFSQTVTSTGGTPPYTYSVVGALPVGIAFSGGGVFSGTPTAGGVYTFDVKSTDASTGIGPYSTTKTYTLNINFLPQTITLAATATANYGDVDIDPGATSSSGLGVSYSTSDASIATIVAGKIHIVGTGTVNIFADQAGDGTYAPATQKTQVLTINKATLTYMANTATKVYGTGNPSFTGTIIGFKYGENLGSATTGTAVFSSPATNLSMIGSYAITGSGLTAANYTFVQATSNAIAFNITQRAITVTASAGQGKIYGAADPTLTYSITSGAPLIGTDTFTGTLTRTTGENVGTAYAISQGTLALNANYILTYAGANFTIAAKAITVTAGSGQSKIYGTVDPTLAYSITNGGPLVTGDAFTGALARATGESVGTYAILQGSLALSANYSLSFTPANFAITPKAVTVTASAGQNKTYGQADPAFAYTITNGGPLVAGDAFTGTLARAAGENVGPYAINQGTLALNGNYTLTYAGANFAINSAALTITADNKERFFGGTNPTLTASYTGFVNGETSTVLTTQPTLTTIANTASPIGDYPITVSGAAAQNYTIAYVNGTLKVKAGAPTNIVLAGVTLYENRPSGTNAGTLSSTSDDPSATFTYTLVTGTGDTDNALFAIAGTSVNTTASLDFETKASYSIRVRSTTQFGLSLEKVLTIALSDVNEVPTLAAINDVTHCFTSTAQVVALSGISAGPETAQTTTISVTSNNAALFESLTATKNGATGSVNYVVKNGASGVATVTVTIKDNGGTANTGVDTYSRTFTVTVNPLPVVTIVSDKGNSISKGDMARLTASGGTSYVWAANNSIISGQNTATLTVRPQANTVYTVTVSNANGCSQSQSFTLNVVEDFAKISPKNILTPNGDGYNDKWVIDNIDFYPNNEVVVFDRAGRIVYKKKGYDNSWDGTANGAPLSENTYYYIIDFGASKLRLKGYITIIRESK